MTTEPEDRFTASKLAYQKLQRDLLVAASLHTALMTDANILGDKQYAALADKYYELLLSL
ncbi:MAG: hypothetical protein NVS3B25_19110 [Hymenobacter sp.]